MNDCLHCHTYYSWLTHQHYQAGRYLIGVQFSYMSDHYQHLAKAFETVHNFLKRIAQEPQE